MTDIMKQYNQLQRAHEAQAEENADLALLADQYKAERDALAAELATLKAQEPVAIVAVAPNCAPTIGWAAGYVAKHNDKLYAAPKALAPLTPEQMDKGQWDDGTSCTADFKAGVRFAEKHYGITKGTP